MESKSKPCSLSGRFKWLHHPCPEHRNVRDCPIKPECLQLDLDFAPRPIRFNPFVRRSLDSRKPNGCRLEADFGDLLQKPHPKTGGFFGLKQTPTLRVLENTSFSFLFLFTSAKKAALLVASPVLSSRTVGQRFPSKKRRFNTRSTSGVLCARSRELESTREHRQPLTIDGPCVPRDGAARSRHVAHDRTISTVHRKAVFVFDGRLKSGDRVQHVRLSGPVQPSDHGNETKGD